MTKPLPKKLLALALTLTVLVALAGCAGSNQGAGGEISSDNFTIYSSLPLAGPSKEVSQQVVNGEKLALKQAGGKVGKWKIGYVSLNDANEDSESAQFGQPSPALMSANARKAAEDQSVIAYLGEGTPGASVISVPILNEAGILAVSPLDSYAGLTGSGGVDSGEPDKYYPTGDRNFARMVPSSELEADAVTKNLKKQKVKKLYLLHGTDLYSRSSANAVERKAKDAGIRVISNDRATDDLAALHASLEEADRLGMDTIYYVDLPGDAALKTIQNLSRVKLFVPSTLATSGFVRQLDPVVRTSIHATSAIADPERYPDSARSFTKAYREEFGSQPGPYAVYGYMAMDSVLGAIKKAGKKGNDRQAVIDQLLGLKAESPLGRYKISAKGDISPGKYYTYAL